jgi:hypothetical protein
MYMQAAASVAEVDQKAESVTIATTDVIVRGVPIPWRQLQALVFFLDNFLVETARLRSQRCVGPLRD